MGVPDFVATRYRQATDRARKRGERIKHGAPLPRKLPALKGHAPKNKNGLLKRSILFGFDTVEMKAIVGPIKVQTGTVRQLDQGGSANLYDDRGRHMRMTFQGNPFMQPALERSKDKVAAIFENIL